MTKLGLSHITPAACAQRHLLLAKQLTADGSDVSVPGIAVGKEGDAADLAAICRPFCLLERHALPARVARRAEQVQARLVLPERGEEGWQAHVGVAGK